MPRAEPFDAAKYLDSPEMITAYLAEASRSNDLYAVAMAVEAVARACVGGKRDEQSNYRKGDLG